MTNEQYYWYVKRQQMLRNYASINNMAKVQVSGADDRNKVIPVVTPTEARKAFTEAKDGDVIKLAAPITIADGQQSIMIDKNIGVNLNGQTIVATTLAGDTKDAVFAVKRGGTLTIDGDGTIDGTQGGTVGYALKTTVKGEDATGEPAKLVINSGTIKGKYSAITGNGSRQNTDVTINGGTFEGTYPGDNYAYYHPENGTLTINNGTFKGNDCIIVKSGTVTINNGTFEANGISADFVHNKNGWNCTGDCIAVEACDYPGSIPNVSINGGTFKSINGKPVASYAQAGYDALSGFVKGGTFNKELDSWIIASGYKQTLSNDWYVVTAE